MGYTDIVVWYTCFVIFLCLQTTPTVHHSSGHAEHTQGTEQALTDAEHDTLATRTGHWAHEPFTQRTDTKQERNEREQTSVRCQYARG